MGYLNNNLGYARDLLATRAIVRRNNFAIIVPDGMVCNVIPGFEQCDITVLGSPQLGASFVDYLVTLHPGGGNRSGFGGEDIETFVYVIDGKVTAKSNGQRHELTGGGYLFCPAGERMVIENDNGSADSRLFLYKRRYQWLEGHKARAVSGNVNQLPPRPYEEMDDVLIQDLLPKELGFDMNMHILSFKPGACHGYIETHLQEHGAYVLSGEGMYNLDNNWIPVKQGDYLFMAAWCPQACYAVGRETPFSYIYSKDCHRDVAI